MATHFVREDVRAHLDFLSKLTGPKIHDVQPEVARAMAQKAATMFEATPPTLATIEDGVLPGPHGGAIRFRLFDCRAEREPGPMVMFFHGGGFVVGDLDSYTPVCAAISTALDLPVVSVDYRLAPEHPWPAAFDDAEAATRWVAEQGGVLGRKATSLVLAGDSAGGMATIITGLALRDAPSLLPVAALWAVYPAVDLRRRYPSTETFGEGYLLTKDTLRWFNTHFAPDFGNWRASPIQVDPAGLPPIIVVTAGLDPLRDQGRAFAARCIDAGVTTIYREAVGTIHGWLTLRKAIPSGEKDLQACLAILKTLIAETTVR